MTSVSLTTRLTITLCFMALLMAVSIIPGHTQSDDSVLIRLVAKTPKLLQKVLHFLLYGVLTMLWVWTLDAILSESYLLVIQCGRRSSWLIRCDSFPLTQAVDISQTLTPSVRFGLRKQPWDANYTPSLG